MNNKELIIPIVITSIVIVLSFLVLINFDKITGLAVDVGKDRYSEEETFEIKMGEDKGIKHTRSWEVESDNESLINDVTTAAIGTSQKTNNVYLILASLVVGVLIGMIIKTYFFNKNR